MRKPRKQKHYLDALEDPLLPEDRRIALQFMSEVDLARLAKELLPTPGDFAKEEVDCKRNFRCVNCNIILNRASLYCDELCRQLVQTVRLIRKAEADQRIIRPDVQEGIGIRLFMLTGGGYPDKERSLSMETRKIILERDKYICQICGKPADQVDHIAGSSSDAENLRVLCGVCNRAEAFNNKREATEEEAKGIREMFADMALRVAAPQPAFLRDDPERWGKCWRGILGARRILFRELEHEQDNDDDDEFEDVDSYLYNAMQKDD